MLHRTQGLLLFLRFVQPDDEGSDTPDEVPTGDAQSADSPLGSSDFASPDSEQPGDTDSPFAPVNQTDMPQLRMLQLSIPFLPFSKHF